MIATSPRHVHIELHEIAKSMNVRCQMKHGENIDSLLSLRFILKVPVLSIKWCF